MDYEFELERFNFKAKVELSSLVMPVNPDYEIGFIIFFMI